MSLPTADDLFRPTDGVPEAESPPPKSTSRGGGSGRPGKLAAAPDPEDQAERRTSGRVRHDEKMTVYVTADELLDLEHARLALRRDHGLAIDRGRLVREAIAMALAELESAGDGSALVQRLTAS
ncbi:MAG TPA: hypothetical protein VF426_10725 [Marmoricola sp.]